MRTNRIMVVFFLITGLLCLRPVSSAAQDAAAKQEIAAGAQSAAPKPFIVYYSQTGSSQKIASTLQNQLGCGIEEIISSSKIGIGTIFVDQVFNRNNKQEPIKQNIAEYDPIILITPIWLMRLSSPARTFIKNCGLKGKEIYIFTVSGGPLSKGRKESFKEFCAEQGLNVKEVHSMQVGKKTAAAIEKEIKEIISRGSLKKYSH